MPIRISFGGATLVRPGSFSRFTVDNSGGANLASNDTIMIVGESSLGAPGSVEGIQEFSASRLPALIEKYGSGPLVDTAFAAVRLAQRPALGIGSAGRVLVWKTNASTQAEVVVDSDATGNLYTVKDRAYGEPGNELSIIIADGTVPATQKSISIARLGGTTENLGENAAQDIISIEYTGDATTAVVDIAGASRAALTLSTTLAGDQTDSSVDLSIPLAPLTMRQLVDTINAQVGYSASVISVPNSVRAATELDVLSAVDITSSVTMRRLQFEILDLINSSDRVEASLEATPIGGLPVNTVGSALSGGAQGASSNSSFSDGYAASLAQDYNVLVPAISRDATEDIADAVLGFTDAASDYTVEAVIAAQISHLNLRGTIQNRREAQGMFGVRKSTRAAAFDFIANRNSELVQGFMQDARVLDVNANLSVVQPHVVAGIAAGIRLGTEVGEPLTHKQVGIVQLGHFINPETLLEEGDLNPALDGDDAILSGVTLLEAAQGGFRIVLDNTTYGVDDNFVLNRGSVLEASFFVFRTLRETAESVFVGRKISAGTADSIRNVVKNRLRELNAPAVNIITSSDDAPEGFVEETFTVTVSGSVATVSVEFKPVQGLEFVLFDFVLGDIQQSA